jgi:hypothetical protein
VDEGRALYAIDDEYGEVQASGAVILQAEGRYSFIVFLGASRWGDDRNGRRYVITVHAQDNAGNPSEQSGTVTVPHDRRQ